MSENKEELKKKTIKGFFWRFSERISSQMVGFVVSVVLARILEPNEYGILALTMVFMAIANVLADSGMGASLVQKKDADQDDFSTMFYSGLFISLFIYFLLFITAPYISKLYGNEQVCNVLRVLGLTLPINSFNSIQQAYVSRQLEFKKFFYSTFIGTLISGIVGIVMAYSGYGVWALVGQQLSNRFVNTVTLYRIIEWRPQLVFSIDKFKELYSFGVKLMGAHLIGTTFNEIKSFVVGIRYMPADLAFFNRGESLPKLVADNVNSTINSVMFPAIAKVQEKKQDVRNAIRRSMMTSSLFISPLMLLLAATADKVTVILLTEKWLPCVPFMQVLCINHCVGVLGTANLQAFNAVGRSDITLKLEFYKKPLYIIMILITMMISPLAIAVGNLLYGIIATLINAWPNKKLIDYNFIDQLRDVFPQLFSAVAMGLIVFLVGFLRFNVYLLLILQFSVGVIIYLFIIRLFSLESYHYVLNTIREIKK